MWTLHVNTNMDLPWVKEKKTLLISHPLSPPLALACGKQRCQCGYMDPSSPSPASILGWHLCFNKTVPGVGVQVGGVLTILTSLQGIGERVASYTITPGFCFKPLSPNSKYIFPESPWKNSQLLMTHRKKTTKQHPSWIQTHKWSCYTDKHRPPLSAETQWGSGGERFCGGWESAL